MNTKNNTNIKLFFTLIISFLLLINCNSVDEQMPYEYFSPFTIDLNEPSFFDLNVIGGHIMVTGGVKGIVIYHESKDVFRAYERCCPFDPGCGRVYYDENSSNVIDTCCNSEFSLILEGMVITGPSTLPLREYVTEYFSNSKKLTVYSDIQF
jgi:hypothetical protein